MSKLLNLTPCEKILRHYNIETAVWVWDSDPQPRIPGYSQSDTYGSLLCPILLQLIPDNTALNTHKRKIEMGSSVYPSLWNLCELGFKAEKEHISWLDLAHRGVCSETQTIHKDSIDKWIHTRDGMFHQLLQCMQPATVSKNRLFSNHKTEPDYTVTAHKEKLKKLGKCCVFRTQTQSKILQNQMCFLSCMQLQPETRYRKSETPSHNADTVVSSVSHCTVHFASNK